MKKNRSRIIVIVFASMAALAVLAVRGMGRFLAAPGKMPAEADAIVILGGCDEPRLDRGSELYREKYAPFVALTDSGEGQALEKNVRLRARPLIAAGLQTNAIVAIGDANTTWEEAGAILRTARERGWRRVIIVSDPPHMRRMLWVFRKQFRGTEVDFVLVPSRPSWWDQDRWWSHPMSRSFVGSELLKVAFYFFKRRLG